MPLASPAIIKDPQRLRALHDLAILDTPAEEAFDRLTRLASKIVNAPVSLVSLVDSDRQFFKSFVGLLEPWASKRETPLSHAFCQHVVASNEPLIIEDARQNALVFDNLGIPNLNIIGYLGFPLTTSDGLGLGSFCVIDGKPRKWTKAEIDIMRELAVCVMVEIELRTEINIRKNIEAELNYRNNQLQRVTQLCRSTISHMADALNHSGSTKEMGEYLKFAQGELDRVT